METCLVHGYLKYFFYVKEISSSDQYDVTSNKFHPPRCLQLVYYCSCCLHMHILNLILKTAGFAPKQFQNGTRNPFLTIFTTRNDLKLLPREQ